jgi:hypothetical protein
MGMKSVCNFQLGEVHRSGSWREQYDNTSCGSPYLEYTRALACV